MGVSGKWIKALVGLKKSEKSPSSEKDENVGIIIFSSFSNIHLLSFQSFFRTLEYMDVIFGILVIDEALICFAIPLFHIFQVRLSLLILYSTQWSRTELSLRC